MDDGIRRSPNGWMVVINGSDDRCVVPIADLREHDIDGTCWCNPVFDDDVIVHNSADGREKYENGRKPS